ncbi:arylesterase [Dinoroseobacter sp. S375]|uniref:arylesterase n=1 Tax=Dinoroseobacter sp. S375 TaxID=3415136 RepID=UPI003C7E1C77
MGGGLRAKGVARAYGARGAFRKARAGLAGLAGAVWLALSPAMAEPVTVAALGDSLTQGYGLPQADGFVPQLQRWLEAQGEEVALINAGVSGDTTAGGLSRVDWTLTPEVDAMIVALGGNDLLRGIDPSVSRANLDGILAKAQARGLPVLLVGLVAPGNYGPEYKASFDAMYPELAETYGTLHVDSFLGALTAQVDQVQAVRDYMQSDGIHPNADGVALIVEALGPEVQALIDRASP